MKRRRLIDVFDVAERNLCCGCGVCAAIAPEEVAMVDDLDEGRRPVKIGIGPGAAEALTACPGVKLEHPQDPPSGVDPSLWPNWGPVRAMWEGYATDQSLRFSASSGGAATAMAQHALQNGFAGVVHIGADPSAPWRNRTYISTTAQEVLQHTGSRYSPASPGEGLNQVAIGKGPFMFIGKPCDVAGAKMVEQLRPDIAENLAITIAIFCAGTPSLRGTLEMLQKMGITDQNEVRSLRYRGQGWPGNAVATKSSEPDIERSLTYEQSWGEILQRHRQWRCRICPDHTGEFADISVGDPWHRPTAGDPGRSLVIARTERGQRFVEQAIASGILTLTVSPHEHLPQSQPNLLGVRGQTWGRLLAMRLLGMPTPVFRNMSMFRPWIKILSTREKLNSILGTMRRIHRRGLARRRHVRPFADAE